MKYLISTMLLFSVVTTHCCILRKIINNSTSCSILIRSVIIPGLEKTKHPNVVPPRAESSIEPVIVDTKGKLGMGEYMRVEVTDKTSYGNTCKKYRLRVDETNNRIEVQRKEGCKKGALEYGIVATHAMDPDHCYVDMYVLNDANSLYIETVSDKDMPTTMPIIQDALERPSFE